MSAAPLAAQSASAARPRGWWPWVAWAAVLALLAMFGWAGWRVYDDRAAVREVEALGFQLLESASPSDHIRAVAQLMELSLNRCTGLSAEVVEAFKKGHPQVAVFGP